jgi:hypothetical protein
MTLLGIRIAQPQREPGENGYTAMKRGRRVGIIDPYQTWVSKTYHSLIRGVIRSNNRGLNIVQITAKLGELLTPGYRQGLEAAAPKHGWKMPKGNPTRKKVGEHVNALWADPEESVAKVGGRYYVVDSSSTELNASVRRVLRKKNLIDWNISLARNLAGCYTATDPAKSHNPFHRLFEEQVKRFIESGYWLDDILAYMITNNLISSEVYSKENGINKKMLREGWESCFRNTRLLLLAYAISPPDFLEYMMSRHGISWATNILEKKWDSIMNMVAKSQRSDRVAALSEVRQGVWHARRREA